MPSPPDLFPTSPATRSLPFQMLAQSAPQPTITPAATACHPDIFPHVSILPPPRTAANHGSRVSRLYNPRAAPTLFPLSPGLDPLRREPIPAASFGPPFFLSLALSPGDSSLVRRFAPADPRDTIRHVSTSPETVPLFNYHLCHQMTSC